MKAYSIGEASRAAGVKAPTIRYYEQIGLLPSARRTEGNRRAFTEEDVGRLSFIRHARELGFEVEAIKTLISLQDNPNQSCEAADKVAREHLADIKKRVGKLNALKDELERMISQCASGSVGECRVLQILSDPSHDHGKLT